MEVDEIGKLKKKELINKAKKFSKLYCVGDGKNFKLKDYPTQHYPDIKKKEKRAAKKAKKAGKSDLSTV